MKHEWRKEGKYDVINDKTILNNVLDTKLESNNYEDGDDAEIEHSDYEIEEEEETTMWIQKNINIRQK